MNHLIKVKWLKGSFENSNFRKKLKNLCRLSQRENVVIIKPTSGNFYKCESIINEAVSSGFANRVSG